MFRNLKKKKKKTKNISIEKKSKIIFHVSALLLFLTKNCL